MSAKRCWLGHVSAPFFGAILHFPWRSGLRLLLFLSPLATTVIYGAMLPTSTQQGACFTPRPCGRTTEDSFLVTFLWWSGLGWPGWPWLRVSLWAHNLGKKYRRRMSGIGIGSGSGSGSGAWRDGTDESWASGRFFCLGGWGESAWPGWLGLFSLEGSVLVFGIRRGRSACYFFSLLFSRLGHLGVWVWAALSFAWSGWTGVWGNIAHCPLCLRRLCLWTWLGFCCCVFFPSGAFQGRC